MEGKEYPTRSKSGVRKTRTPWDNSSNLLFDELVGVKRSPKTPPTNVKGSYTPSPKTSGKRTPSQSPTMTISKDKKSKMSISPKIRSGGNSIKKKSSPHTTTGTPSPHNTKVFYDYTHSPSAKITAISLSPSISSSHGAREPVGGAVGGVSPRKKFSGLFKAQKPKISKTAHKKLRESLKIFDFDSESDGEDEIAEKKSVKSKTPPTSKAVTKEVKGEDDNVAIKTQTNSNYRRAPVKKVIAKKITPTKKATPTTGSTHKATPIIDPAPKKPSKSKKAVTGESEGGGGGKRKRQDEGEREDVKKMKVTETEEVSLSTGDLSHYQNYSRLTRSAYHNIEKLIPDDDDDDDGVGDETSNNTTESEDVPINAQQSAPQSVSSQSTPITTSQTTPPITSSQATPTSTTPTQDTPQLSTSHDTPNTISTLTDTPNTISTSNDTPNTISTTSDTPNTISTLTDTPNTISTSSQNQNKDMECDNHSTSTTTDHMTTDSDHVTSHDPCTALDAVEEPINSIVLTEPVKPVTETKSSSTELMETDTMTTETNRSFTPPPHSILSDVHSHSTKHTESQSHSNSQSHSSIGAVSETGNDDTISVQSKEEEKETQTQVEQSADLSLSEAIDKPAFTDFERHLTVPTIRKTLSSAVAILSPTKTYSGASSIMPSLSRSSTWPRSSPSLSKPSHNEKESQLCTVVRNVRQAHECLESGENQQFFDEIEYLMDSIQQSQPISVRCLGICNLATQCLGSEFSQQIRAHEFIPKITSALKDLLQHPTLCLTSSVLFYVMTRDKFNSDWDKDGIGLLCGLLKETTAGLEQRLGGGKAAREWDRMLTKARSILERVLDGGVSESESEKKEGGEGGGEEESPLDVAKTERKTSVELYIDLKRLEVSDMARECLVSLTAPVNSPHWIREELRISGGLDILANMAIDSYNELEDGGDGEGGDDWREGGESVTMRLTSLERILKCLENVTLMNKDNQSYLVIFDGSLLISKLLKMLSLCQKIIMAAIEKTSSIAVPVLLAVLRVLLNLTHDNELGSHRLGEQDGAVKTVLDIVFMLCDTLPDEHRFDTLVLGLGLLINMIEHNTSNRQQLERLPVNYHIPMTPGETQGAQHSSPQDTPQMDDIKSDESSQESGCGLLKGRNSCIKSLISLFLKHYKNAEGATIEVPTPQRLSQISSSPHSSPHRPGVTGVKRDLTPSFADRLKAQNTQREKRSKERSRKKKKKSKSVEEREGVKGAVRERKEGDDEPLCDSQDSQKTEIIEEEEEESESSESETEDAGIDPLVFSRDDFDTALSQAGQQMEDSVVAAYCALVLGLLAKHNLDTVDVVRNGMPSKTFDEMMSVLRKFVSFMNLTGSGSGTGLENVRRIIKYLEAV